MSSGVSAKVPDDDPLMIAWKAYLESEDYDNAKRWAETFVIEGDGKLGTISAKHPHLEGSLWAMFAKGFQAGKLAAVAKEAAP